MSRVVHDTAGRQRFELPAIETVASGQHSQVLIYDVVRKQVIKLDPQSRTATVAPMTLGRPVTIVLSARRGFPCTASPGGESLGVRWIEGLEACGQRVVQTLQKNGRAVTQGRELWLSTTYLMPLMGARDDPRFGLMTQTVVGFDAAEPDASLFEVPPGYTIVRP
jgi:hypothetical protein